jgi:hypothetical protein
MLELIGVLMFAINITLTFLLGNPCTSLQAASNLNKL